MDRADVERSHARHESSRQGLDHFHAVEHDLPSNQMRCDLLHDDAGLGSVHVVLYAGLDARRDGPGQVIGGCSLQRWLIVCARDARALDRVADWALFVEVHVICDEGCMASLVDESRFFVVVLQPSEVAKVSDKVAVVQK